MGSPVSFGGSPVEVAEVVVELLKAGSEVAVVFDVVEVFWFLSVAVGVALGSVVVPVAAGVVVALLPWARAAAEKRENTANVERRSDRFKDSRDDPIATVSRSSRSSRSLLLVRASTDCSQCFFAAIVNRRPIRSVGSNAGAQVEIWWPRERKDKAKRDKSVDK